jgi:hypothetical protein
MNRASDMEADTELDPAVKNQIESLRRDAITGVESAAFRKLLTDLGGLDAEKATELTAIEKVEIVVERIDDLEDTVKTLRQQNKRFEQLLEDAGGKEKKVADIVKFASNVRGGQPVVQLTAKEIKGAVGCSRRYAYDLIEDLPDEYDWALEKSEIRQYGDLEIKKDDDTRRLGIDFEGVHSTGVDVNKFTTQFEGEGGEE